MNDKNSSVLDKGDWNAIADRFHEVKDRVEKNGSVAARHLLFKKSWNFYRTHTSDQCVRIILNESKQ